MALSTRNFLPVLKREVIIPERRRLKPKKLKLPPLRGSLLTRFLNYWRVVFRMPTPLMLICILTWVCTLLLWAFILSLFVRCALR
jgi:hypothetical protein